MYKLFSLVAIGLTSAGLMLATPSASQAQVPLGVRVNVGPVGVSYSQGPVYVAPPYVNPVPVVTYAPPTCAPTVVTPAPVIVQPSLSVGFGNGWYRHGYHHYVPYHHRHR